MEDGRQSLVELLALLLSIAVLSTLQPGCSEAESTRHPDLADLAVDTPEDSDSDVTEDQSSAMARSLVDHALWEPRAGSDPLDHAPEVIDCPEAAWGLEINVLDVETGACNYLSLVQPSIDAVAAGEEVAIFLTHFPLWAESPAEAHVAVLIDEELIWEAHVPIPSPSGLLEGTWIAPAGIPEGTPIRFHLHNHGTNSWSLVDIEARAP